MSDETLYMFRHIVSLFQCLNFSRNRPESKRHIVAHFGGSFLALLSWFSADSGIMLQSLGYMQRWSAGNLLFDAALGGRRPAMDSSVYFRCIVPKPLTWQSGEEPRNHRNMENSSRFVSSEPGNPARGKSAVDGTDSRTYGEQLRKRYRA